MESSKTKNVTSGLSDSYVNKNTIEINQQMPIKKENVLIKVDSSISGAILPGLDTPKPSSKFNYQKDKELLNKTLENIESSIFQCNSEIEEIHKIIGYESIKVNMLLESTQKLQSLKAHVLSVNQHFDRITEVENINEVEQETISNVLTIAGIEGYEKEKEWLLIHDWKGLLRDVNIHELFKDNSNSKDQKEKIASIIISKY